MAWLRFSPISLFIYAYVRKEAVLSSQRDLKNLTTLSLSGMKVTDVSVLRGIENLTYLDLSGTKVTDVSVLGELKNLRIIQ